MKFSENKYTNFKNGVSLVHGGMHGKPQHSEELPQIHSSPCLQLTFKQRFLNLCRCVFSGYHSQ